ncbi:MAG: tetratricopeptide repeat protein [candidate division Zixibacteria bacterium]|nr:tetratricopeptide repeat protein [candidate division Zixibacteria bacterium]
MIEMEKFEKEVKNNPEDIGLLTTLGNIYFDLEETDRAIETYNKVLSVEPDNDAVLVDCGVMYRAKGKFDKAIEYLDKALRSNPQNKQALFNKTIIYRFDLNDLESAQKSFKELQDKFPDDPHIAAFSKELGL